ncbi:MAG: glycosyl transferase family 2 [Neobacillus sp.]|nr:glycosyl transferase family 2 [Neobacillus sp.]
MKKTIVIVVYKTILKDSSTFSSLVHILKKNPPALNDFSLIIYDNSPERQEIPIEYQNLNIIYKHDTRNIGIVTAYNFAFQVAKENGSDWLILLDHDTELTEDYFDQFRHLESFDSGVVAVVPKIYSENTMISPVFSNAFRPLKEKRPDVGVQNTPVMAINSGALIRISFLNEIGGFNRDFPLDFLDHWLFYEIYAKGYKVSVLNTSIEHELSVMDYSRVSVGRYHSILDSEMKFYKNYKKELLPAYRSQLIKRFFKQVLLVKNKKIAAYTLRRLVSM